MHLCSIAIVAQLLWAQPAPAQTFDQADFQSDFQTLVTEIESTYAYFDHKQTRWHEVPELYRADLARVATKSEFIGLLERVLDELYDAHAQLTVNTAESPRLVPSGTDLWAQWIDGRAVITEVRRDSEAASSGIVAGDTVISIDDIPIADAIDLRLGRAVDHRDKPARDWALRAVLAGRHGHARKLTVATRTVTLPAADDRKRESRVSESRLDKGLGYIRFNDSLGENETIAEFDDVLGSLSDTRGLIIDLRDTASGGNSTVARAILGRFITREQPYQKHVLTAEENETGIRRSWLELVSPRGPFTYKAPVVVLTDHWTGSMGEGIAIGFDAIHRGTIIGTAMAGLLGATYHINLPRTNIGVNVPAERLYHVNGTPREQFVPSVLVDVRVDAHGDPILERGIAVLRRNILSAK